MSDARIEAAANFLRECGAGDDALDLATGVLNAAAESEQSIATQLAAALRSLVEPLGEVVVVNAGVMPTIVAPSMNGIIGPFNQARVALAAFDAVYGPQPAKEK